MLAFVGTTRADMLLLQEAEKLATFKIGDEVLLHSGAIDVICDIELVRENGDTFNYEEPRKIDVLYTFETGFKAFQSWIRCIMPSTRFPEGAEL